MNTIQAYLRDLTDTTGHCWNEFWFRPRDASVVCLLRICSGLLAFYWVLTFTPDLIVLFGPGGLIPLDLLQTWVGDRWMVSYFNLLDSPAELWTAHILGLIVLALYTAGAFTRVTSILALLVVLSYVHRAPMLASQFDPILSLVMFYLCFAPCGAYWSVDALRQRRKLESQTALVSASPLRASAATTVSTRLIQVHLSLVYAMLALSKLTGAAWWSGRGVWLLVARPESRTIDLTTWLAEHPFVFNGWTHAIVLFELAFAILIWNRWARPLLLALSLVMWPSLALISGLHLYCAMMLVAGLAFVDPAWMRTACPWCASESRLAAPATASA